MSTKSKTVFLSVSNSEVSLNKLAKSACYTAAIITTMVIIFAAYLVILTFLFYYYYNRYFDWKCKKLLKTLKVKNLIVFALFYKNKAFMW